MYPFVTIWWRHIEMTGLGFVLWLATFCLVCYIRSNKVNLIFWDLFYALPSMIALIYFTGSYSYVALNTGHIIPHTILEFSHIIIPPNYNFYAGGLLIGVVFSLLMFLYSKPDIIRKKWIDCLFLSYMNGLIIFWLFLVLGDDMIGLSTDSILWVYSMTPYSEVAKFNQVYPVWLGISFSALISLAISLWIIKRKTLSWRWTAWFGLFYILIGFVLLFQNYPRHGVLQLWDFALDANQYIARIIGSILIWQYIYSLRHHNTPIIRIKT